MPSALLGAEPAPAPCPLQPGDSTAGGKTSWRGTTCCPQPKGSHITIRGAHARGWHCTRGTAPSKPAPAQGRSGDLQRPGPARTRGDRQADGLTHLGTASAPPRGVSPVPRSKVKAGGVGFFPSPVLPLGLPARAYLGQAGRERAGAEPMPAPLSSACQGSPPPRVGDSSWGCQ